MIWLYSPVPRVWTPGANQYVLPAWSRSTELLLPAGTTIAPAGALAGPFSTAALPQILAGGALGQDPLGPGGVGVAVVVVVVVVGDGSVVVVEGGGAVVVVGDSLVGVVVGAVVVVVGEGAMVVAVGGVGLGVVPAGCPP